MRRRMLAGVLLLLAGCAGPDDRDPTAPPIAAFRSCEYQYPDGTPIDCERNEAVRAEPVFNKADWRCLVDKPGDPVAIQVWAKQNGEVLLIYQWPSSDHRAIHLGSAETLQGERTTKVFLGAREGIVFIGRVQPASFQARLDIHEVFSEGSLPDFGSDVMDMHVTGFERRAWPVYEYTVGGASHYFHAMADGRPVERRWDGSDFWLHVKTRSQVVEQAVEWPGPQAWVVPHFPGAAQDLEPACRSA